jgi:hypothetical protein
MKNNAQEACINIYVNPEADLDSYPSDLLGDMRVFKGFRSEVQWLFYLMLRDQGMDVRICRDYPKEGIFVIHRGNVRKFIWNPALFVISGQWDYLRDDRAQVHLVSNVHKTTNASLNWLDRLSFAGLQCYVPPVTHPVIIPRDPSRGERFENIVFIGDPKNLDVAFRTDAFRTQVAALGMKFIIKSDPQKMSDFSNVDAVVAVRKIGRVISNKPPTKLINAWRGGVPSLLGCEVGFREARESEYDYIEVDSTKNVVDGLIRLKNDVKFRDKMIENGHQRALPFTAEEQQKTWVNFFKLTVLPAYHSWQNQSTLSKWAFLFVRWLRYLVRGGLSYIWNRVLRRRSRGYS